MLLVIFLIFAYGEYKDYKRFHPENANIKIDNSIDLNYHNVETVYNYHDALEAANSYMQMQWSANRIDVRSPKNDDEETLYAITEYGKKVGKLNYYKSILKQSKTLKSQGLQNEDIKLLETKGYDVATYKKAEAALKLKQSMLNIMPQKALYSGEKSVFVYELQKLLVKKGHDIEVDGVAYEMKMDGGRINPGSPPSRPSVITLLNNSIRNELNDQTWKYDESKQKSLSYGSFIDLVEQTLTTTESVTIQPAVSVPIT